MKLKLKKKNAHRSMCQLNIDNTDQNAGFSLVLMPLAWEVDCS